MTVIWFGLGLGVLQLLAGTVVGWSLSRRWGGNPCRGDASQLHQLAQHVHNLVRDVHGQVDEHQSEIQRIRRELHPDTQDEDSLAAAIFRSVSRVIEANERLQERLFHAEESLKTKEREIESHMAEARTDALTSLPNRRAFNDAIGQQVALQQRNGLVYGLIHLDIDHFKRLNDGWGHPAGDEVLKSVAAVIRRTARLTDLVARIGGEEFAVILPDTSVDAVIAASERIRIAVETASFCIKQDRLPVSISVGAAVVAEGETLTSLVARADEALYASKAGGRNCCHWHDGERCQRIAPSGERPTLSDSGRFETSCRDWQDEPAWHRICNELRRGLAELIGRDG